MDPKVPANVFKPVFEEFASVEALDARRFEVRFPKPYAFRAMAFVLPLLPEHAFAGQNFLKAKQNRAPLSNGPYRLVAWKAQESDRARAQREVLRARAAISTAIVFRILPDNTTAYRLLVDGRARRGPDRRRR